MLSGQVSLPRSQPILSTPYLNHRDPLSIRHEQKVATDKYRHQPWPSVHRDTPSLDSTHLANSILPGSKPPEFFSPSPKSAIPRDQARTGRSTNLSKQLVRLDPPGRVAAQLAFQF